MKKALEKISTVLRVVAGIVCAIFTVTFVVLIFTEKPVEVFVFMAVLFAGLTALLLFPRKRHKQNSAEYSAPAQPVQFEVPEYILQDMRGTYSVMQAKDDARIMLESHKLVQQTMSLPTFLSRLQLSRQKALTLLQAEKAGIKGLSQIKMTDKCSYIQVDNAFYNAKGNRLVCLNRKQQRICGRLVIVEQERRYRSPVFNGNTSHSFYRAAQCGLSFQSRSRQ